MTDLTAARAKAERRGAASNARGMANTALQVTLDDQRLGVHAPCILPTREGGKRCADPMQRDGDGLCLRMIARDAP